VVQVLLSLLRLLLLQLLPLAGDPSPLSLQGVSSPAADEGHLSHHALLMAKLMIEALLLLRLPLLLLICLCSLLLYLLLLLLLVAVVVAVPRPYTLLLFAQQLLLQLLLRICFCAPLLYLLLLLVVVVVLVLRPYTLLFQAQELLLPPLPSFPFPLLFLALCHPSSPTTVALPGTHPNSSPMALPPSCLFPYPVVLETAGLLQLL
jgi:hypothetical protein